MLASIEDPELASRPAFVASQAAVLEAAGRAPDALKLVTGAHEALLAEKGRLGTAKTALDRDVLPILARLQLKVLIDRFGLLRGCVHYLRSGSRAFGSCERLRLSPSILRLFDRPTP